MRPTGASSCAEPEFEPTGADRYHSDIGDDKRRVSRRSLLAAGIAGAGAALLAPGQSLLAIAGGADRPAGLWSVVRDPANGRLVALSGSADGATVHALDIGPAGRLAVGARLWDPLPGLVPLALGATPGGVVVIATAIVTEAEEALAAAADEVLVAELLAEPGSPLAAPATPTERLRSVAVALRTGAVAEHPGPGLVSALAGRWVVRQHGPDDEADHLPSVSAARGGVEDLVLDGLGMAGAARLGGPWDAPVLAVADGADQVRIQRLGAGEELAPLEDSPLVAVTGTDTDVFATVPAPSGELVLHRAVGDRWVPEGPLGPARSVLAVSGASELVVTTGDDATLVDLAGSR